MSRSTPITRRRTRTETRLLSATWPRNRTGAGRFASRCALLLALSAAAVLAPSAAEAQAGVSLPPGTTAPAVSLEDLDGNAVKLHDVIAGRPALLEFWATWCPLCEELQPRIDAVHAAYGDRLAIVAIAVAVNQNPRRIKRHLEDHDPGYPFLYDRKGEAVRAFQAATTSIVVLLDENGRVVYTGSGGNQDLAAAVRKVMGS